MENNIEELKEGQRFWLTCLENAGVDNWDGIDHACDLLDIYNQ